MEQVVTIQNDEGLHARPAGIFAKKAAQFKSQVMIQTPSKKVNAKSIMSLMGLGIEKGHQITIITEGEDEQEAMKSLVQLIESKFA